MKVNKNSFDEPAKIIKRKDAPEETVYALTFSEGFVNFFKKRFSKENFRRIMKESFPQKEDSVKEKVRKCIMNISLFFLILGLSYFVFYYHGYRERIALFDDWQKTIEEIDESKLSKYEIDKLWENIREQYPDVDFPEGMSIKFASLYAVNQDAVGVLQIPEKELWFPLFQNKEIPDYYLWKDMYGEYNRYGNPYVDHRCDLSKDGPGANTIIYGHNTHDRLGFNILESYMTLDGYKEAPVVRLDTLFESTQWKIFAVILTNSTPSADRGHVFSYLYPEFSSSDHFSNVIGGILQRSIINTNVDVREDDKILTLYTCYQDIFEGGRLVVFARLLRDGEKVKVDVSKASYNNSARYPQIFYDKKGLKNPYEHLTVPNVQTENTTSAVVTEPSSSGNVTPTVPVIPETPSVQIPENTTVPPTSEPATQPILPPVEPSVVPSEPAVAPDPAPTPDPVPAPEPEPAFDVNTENR